MISTRSLLLQASRSYCDFQARTIAFLFPPSLWYWASYRFCRLQVLVASPLLFFSPFRSERQHRLLTRLMEAMVHRLVMLRRPFPIPIHNINAEVVREARKNPNGIVLCSVHLPFVHLVLRCLVELGMPPTAVISGRDGIVDKRLPLWGMAESLPAFAPDRNVLAKARTILRKGGFVSTLIDASRGGPMDPNALRFIRSVGARLVFFTTELQSDGQIAVEFFAPPDPFCLSDESVIANLQALERKRARIVQLASGQPGIKDTSPQARNAENAESRLQTDSFS
jgi:hypothetical protein